MSEIKTNKDLIVLLNFLLFILFMYVLIHSTIPSPVNSVLIIMKHTLVLNDTTSSPATEVVLHVFGK